MDLKEFKVIVGKRNQPRKTKISNSWGIYDSYKVIRKNGWYNIGRPLKEHEFYSIVRQVNDYLAREIANGNVVNFPSRMGYLELRRIEKGVTIVNGKLMVNYPINWEETLRLWYEDEEARKKKTVLRDESGEVYKVKYVKYNATYENKSFYQFTLNRSIKVALKNNIKQGKINTLW